MSHIPASKMPHAKPHDDDAAEHGNGSHAPQAAEKTAEEADGVVDTVKEQAAKVTDAASSAAGSAGEAVKSAAAAVSEQAGSTADAATGVAKKAAGAVGGLPTYAKLLGAAALVGGIAAVAFLPFFQQPEETGRGKRKKGKAGKKA